MNFLIDLAKHYDNNHHLIGVYEKTDFADYSPLKSYTLMRPFHSILKSDVEITLDSCANFVSMRYEEMIIVAPATEGAEGRSGAKIAPYPLFDKIEYLAGDYNEYFPSSKSAQDKFDSFIKNLDALNNTGFTFEDSQIIYKYITKKTLISDMIFFEKNNDSESNDKIVKLDEKGNILKINEQFIRFKIQDSTPYWFDDNKQRNFSEYALSECAKTEGFCYLSGKVTKVMNIFPSKLKSYGDHLKLVSAPYKNIEVVDLFPKKSSTFQEGMHELATKSAPSIDVLLSYKSHNMIRWLINKNKTRVGNKHILVWSEGRQTDTPPLLFCDISVDFTTDKKKLKELLVCGYQEKYPLSPGTIINILILDSFDERKGRMQVLEYKKMRFDEYIDKLADWYSKSFWIVHSNKKEKIKFVSFSDINTILFAFKENDFSGKDTSNLLNQILYSILNKVPLTPQISNSLLRKAFSSNSFYRKDLPKLNWYNSLPTVCAILNHFWFDGNFFDADIKAFKETEAAAYYFAVMDEFELVNESKLTSRLNLGGLVKNFLYNFVKNPQRLSDSIYKYILSNYGNLIPEDDRAKLERQQKEIKQIEFNTSNKINEYVFLLVFSRSKLELAKKRKEKRVFH